jgi:condensin-2 complex subunit D3
VNFFSENVVLEKDVQDLVFWNIFTSVAEGLNVRTTVAKNVLKITKPALSELLDKSWAESVRMRLFSAEVLKNYDCENEEEKLKVFKRLMSFCQDQSPKIRARVLGLLAECVEEFEDGENGENVETVADSEKTELFKKLPWFDLIKMKINDDRSPVRKSVYKLVVNLLLKDWLPRSIHGKLLLTGCTDSSVSVRKQCIEATHKLYLKFELEVAEFWFDAILPGLCDREASVNELAFGLAYKILIEDLNEECCWNLYEKMDMKHRRYLRMLFSVCKKNKCLPVDFMLDEIHQKLDKDENLKISWLLLNFISQQSETFSKKILKALLTEFKKTDASGENITCTNPDIIATASNYIQMKDHLLKCLWSIDARHAIPAIFESVEKIIKKEAEKNGYETFLKNCMEKANKNIEELVILKLGKGLLKFGREEEISQNVAMIGELGQRMPKNLENGTLLALQILVIQTGNKKQKKDVRVKHRNSDAIAGEIATPEGRTVASQNFNDIHDDITARLEQSVRNLTTSYHQSTFFENSKNPDDTLETSNPELEPDSVEIENSTHNRLIPSVSNELRSLAILSLGKLSIQQLDLAKQVVAVIGHELKASKSSIVRNNAMLALSDITVRKTQLVTPYVEIMANALHDVSDLVRRQTIVALSSLLQQGYLKWNEALFYKYVSSLNDENKEVSGLAEYTLVDMQQSKHEGMFSKYVIECIYYYNGFVDDAVYNKFGRSEQIKPEMRHKDRMRLYRFLIRHMNDSEKFNLRERLTTEILARIISNDNRARQNSARHNSGAETARQNEDSNITEQGLEMIADTFQILLCKEIQLQCLKELQEEIADQDVNRDEGLNAAADQVSRNKKHGIIAGITQLKKTQAVEKMLPNVVATMNALEKGRHLEILEHCVEYLVEFKKENEKELHDVLSSDRQMMSEVNYMLKRYQASKEKDKNRPSLDTQEEDNQENDRDKVSSSQNPSKKRVKREAMLETTNLNNSMDGLHV